ncbi:DgyrCDS7801 [Dimorphilus gyrociliatus]|uniref:DgyrCDS7801 n=1 Tax=Dimorphilus gyrociliatus TaxID=2664684 RepID=A0A7I8VUP3_9ANNE|nr:DgyrCDS7801 [Dimorphilus gyrociliatus]
MSVTYLGAMLASNHALQFVPYPTQVLGKSVKPIPVMILGVLLAGKRYPLRKYLFIVLIVAGVALFMYKEKKGAATTVGFGFGEILLITSLLLDGGTGSIQDKIRSNYTVKTFGMMLFMNVWSVLYLGIGLLLTGEAFSFPVFSFKYPSVLLHIFIFSLASAVGQFFIFMTVTNFGPLPCSIITTTRKFFTILFSVFIYGHPMIIRQWIGTICVFIGLGLDSAYGKQKRKVEKIEKS